MPKNKDNYPVKVETYRLFSWPTSDWWYPNFPNNTVRVCVASRFDKKERSARRYRVYMSVYSLGNLSLLKEVYTGDDQEAEKAVKELCQLADNLPNPITKDWLIQRGFRYD